MPRATTHATHRSDADLFVEARNALDRSATVPGTVRVHIDQGVATLTGSVRLASEMTDAENAVRRIPGIQRVVSEVIVEERPSEEGFEPPE